jgi:undecaprenyl phosphate-alpha-L-ara4N flippase subunit ArnE
MGVGFFIWLALLSSLDLSFLYPFEGLNRLAMLIVAAFFLKEKVTARLWLGVVLISAGVALVASS